MTNEGTRGRRTGLRPDQLVPTERQIAENIIVIPKAFLDQAKLNHHGFKAIVLGDAIENRKVDSENRVSLPIRNRVTVGERLRLRVQDGVLHLEQDS